MEMASNNLCDSCANIGCEFQSGIFRTECAFYMPQHIEPDNYGNYVVQEPTQNPIIDWNNCHTSEQLKSISITKNDLGVDNKNIRLIDANALIKRLRPKHFDWWGEGEQDDFSKGNNSMLEEVIKAIEEFPSVTPQDPRWISISERLPEENITVIASTDYGIYPEARYSKENGWEWAYESGADYWEELVKVKAWMYLPKPYEPTENRCAKR